MFFCEVGTCVVDTLCVNRHLCRHWCKNFCKHLCEHLQVFCFWMLHVTWHVQTQCCKLDAQRVMWTVWNEWPDSVSGMTFNWRNPWMWQHTFTVSLHKHLPCAESQPCLLSFERQWIQMWECLSWWQLFSQRSLQRNPAGVAVAQPLAVTCNVWCHLFILETHAFLE